jgi:hypothetical protein
MMYFVTANGFAFRSFLPTLGRHVRHSGPLSLTQENFCVPGIGPEPLH